MTGCEHPSASTSARTSAQRRLLHSHHVSLWAGAEFTSEFFHVPKGAGNQKTVPKDWALTNPPSVSKCMISPQYKTILFCGFKNLDFEPWWVADCCSGRNHCHHREANCWEMAVHLLCLWRPSTHRVVDWRRPGIQQTSMDLNYGRVILDPSFCHKNILGNQIDCSSDAPSSVLSGVLFQVESKLAKLASSYCVLL